jgi:heptosyltransferase-1
MTGLRVLLLKLSSLGDVIHQLPALTDLHALRPEVVVDWAVEEAYASLVGLHPSVTRAIPVALRRLRAQPGSSGAWKSLGASLALLRRGRYDRVIDTQGLLKSAILARFARGPRYGYDRSSIREPAASLLLDVRVSVSRERHAVDRIRALFAGVFGYVPSGPADYGLGGASLAKPDWTPPAPYVVALHATSRHDKRWADTEWVRLADRLEAAGLSVVYPWGNASEREVAERLVAQSGAAVLAPRVSLIEAAGLLRHAAAVVGVDTGLAHLAAALGTPTVGIYVATKPGLTGLTGGGTLANLGAPGAPPTSAAVMEALRPALERT